MARKRKYSLLLPGEEPKSPSRGKVIFWSALIGGLLAWAIMIFDFKVETKEVSADESAYYDQWFQRNKEREVKALERIAKTLEGIERELKRSK